MTVLGINRRPLICAEHDLELGVASVGMDAQVFHVGCPLCGVDQLFELRSIINEESTTEEGEI